MKAFQLIPDLLSQQGVGVVFSMLGETNCNWITDGVERGKFRFVRARHEEVAVNASVGFARSTGTLGVASVSRGPGFANCMNALIAATRSHVPMLLIAGESPPTGRRFSEQDIDQAGFTALIGAGFQHVATGAELEEAFWTAVEEALHFGRPQVLSTGDLIVGDESPEVSVKLGAQRDIERREVPDSEAVSRVVDLLEQARSPLVIAGAGAVLSGAEAELVEFADLVGARVATTLRANRFFTGHPHDLGLCGEWSFPASREIILASDVVVAFGASLNKNTLGGGAMFPGAKLVQCEINPDKPVRATSSDLALLGDARASARALTAEWRRRGLAPRPVQGVTPPVSALRKSVLFQDLNHDASRGLDVLEVLDVVDQKLPADRIVVTDSGRTKGMTSALVGARDARSWLIGRGYGSVGLGLGTAIGAAVAHPRRPVAAILGDGGFMMAVAALDTARLTPGLNLKVVILNDEMLGAERKHVVRHQLPLHAISQDLPDMVALADLYGGRGTVIRTREDLLRFTFLPHGLEIVDMRIDPLQESEHAFR